MDALNEKNPPGNPPDAGVTEAQVASIWQFAQFRLKTLWSQPAVRQETALLSILVFLLFAPAFPGWWHRWILIGSPQLYALLVLPLVFLWARFSRLRLMVPELDSVIQDVQNQRALPLRFPTEREDPDGSILQALLENPQFPVKRPLWPLLLGCLCTAFAYWVREPLLTYLAFLLILIGIVTYRHGTRMLRLTAFPLFFLTLFAPLPGMILDWLNERIQGLMFNTVLHILLNANIEAELLPEGNPLKINPKVPQPYELFAAQAGLGLPEVWLVLMLAIWFLSLVRVPFRTKLVAVLGCALWMAILALLRLLLLCWMGTMDRDMTSLMEPVTRLLLVLFGVGGGVLILRGLKCQKFQRWVSI